LRQRLPQIDDVRVDAVAEGRGVAPRERDRVLGEIHERRRLGRAGDDERQTDRTDAAAEIEARARGPRTRRERREPERVDVRAVAVTKLRERKTTAEERVFDYFWICQGRRPGNV
jgi:hypothetical protein